MRRISILISLLFFALPAFAQMPDSADAPRDSQPFGLWLESVQRDADARGISPQITHHALAGLTPEPRVVVLDRAQPETRQTLEQYLQNVVPQSRIEKAQRVYAQNQALLEKIGAEYGVEPEYIVALWGIESSFGEKQGNFGIVRALATLAYDGRRSGYFRGELLNALAILDAGDVEVEQMKGSWAGAMGQCQFMPSSFLRYAVDADGDGRRDIWASRSDALASIANYLHSEGWVEGADNSRVLMRWNRSRYFVAAVNRLAQSL